MSKQAAVLDPKEFNYALLRSDLNTFCKKEGYTQRYVSKNLLFRGDNYLYNSLSRKALPAMLLTPICEILHVKASKYMIGAAKEEDNKNKVEVKTEPKQEPEAEVVPEVSSITSGWECRIRVDEDFETVMMKIMKDGEEKAISRCYFFSKDDTGIIQAISYAAHQCYKSFQQTEFARKEVNKSLLYGSASGSGLGITIDGASDTVSFKNWILKFKADNSRIGSLARYCERVFSTMPSHGERKLRLFFQMEKDGREHLEAFNAIWPLYIKEASARPNLD